MAAAMAKQSRMPATLEIQDAGTRRSIDPTGTSGLRRTWRSVAELRLRQLRAQLRIAVIDNDILGLGGSLAQYTPAHARLKAMQEWFTRLSYGIMGGGWPTPHVTTAWQSGHAAAMRETGKAATLDHFAAEHLAQLAQAEFVGIAAALSQQVTRASVEAVVRKMRPHQAYALMVRPFDKMAVHRVRTNVNVIAVSAHNQAKIAAYREMGVSRVGVVPESKNVTHVRMRQTVDAFNPDEPRDEHGEWTAGGAGSPEGGRGQWAGGGGGQTSFAGIFETHSSGFGMKATILARVQTAIAGKGIESPFAIGMEKARATIRLHSDLGMLGKVLEPEEFDAMVELHGTIENAWNEAQQDVDRENEPTSSEQREEDDTYYEGKGFDIPPIGWKRGSPHAEAMAAYGALRDRLKPAIKLVEEVRVDDTRHPPGTVFTGKRGDWHVAVADKNGIIGTSTTYGHGHEGKPVYERGFVDPRTKTYWHSNDLGIDAAELLPVLSAHQQMMREMRADGMKQEDIELILDMLGDAWNPDQPREPAGGPGGGQWAGGTAYHGTGQDKPHSNWYTTSKGLAQNYAKTSAEAFGGTPKVITASLSIKKPYVTGPDTAEYLGYDKDQVARLGALGHDVIMSPDGHEICVIDPTVISTPLPAIKLYRGESVYNKGGNFYTTDPEWARQFTQSGQLHEVKSASLVAGKIYDPPQEVYAGDPDKVDVAMQSGRAREKTSGQDQATSLLTRSRYGIKVSGRSWRMIAQCSTLGCATSRSLVQARDHRVKRRRAPRPSVALRRRKLTSRKLSAKR
jgi:hypothetical protein